MGSVSLTVFPPLRSQWHDARRRKATAGDVTVRTLEVPAGGGKRCGSGDHDRRPVPPNASVLRVKHKHRRTDINECEHQASGKAKAKHQEQACVCVCGLVGYLDTGELVVEPGGELRTVLHGRDLKELKERWIEKMSCWASWTSGQQINRPIDRQIKNR